MQMNDSHCAGNIFRGVQHKRLPLSAEVNCEFRCIWSMLTTICLFLASHSAHALPIDATFSSRVQLKWIGAAAEVELELFSILC